MHFRAGWKPTLHSRSRQPGDAAVTLVIEPPVHVTGRSNSAFMVSPATVRVIVRELTRGAATVKALLQVDTVGPLDCRCGLPAVCVRGCVAARGCVCVSVSARLLIGVCACTGCLAGSYF